MPDYNTAAIPDGVSQGLDQISRQYANGKIADNIVRVNPEMLSMLNMSKEQFGSMSSSDRSSAITGAITALGVKSQQIQVQQQQAAADAAARSAAGRANLNNFIANDDGTTPAPTPAPGSLPAPAPAPAPGGQITPGIPLPPQSAAAPAPAPPNVAGFRFPAPAPAQPLAPPPNLPQPSALAPAAPTPAPGSLPAPAPSQGQRFLKAMAQSGMVGDPNADRVLQTLDRFDPNRFAPGPSQFDTQDIAGMPGAKLVSKRGSKDFKVVYANGGMANLTPVIGADGNPTGQMMFMRPDGKGGTVINPPDTSKSTQEGMQTVVEGEKALQGIDTAIGKYNNQLAASKKTKDDLGYEPPAAPDPSILQELTDRRATVRNAMSKAAGSGSANTAAPAANGGNQAAAQVLIQRASQAIAQGKDPVATKALLAKKLQALGAAAPQ